MPKLPSLTPRQIVKALKKIGFTEFRQKGSHLIMVREDGNRKTVIPMHNKDVKKGLLHSIIEDTGLTAEEFQRYL